MLTVFRNLQNAAVNFKILVLLRISKSVGQKLVENVMKMSKCIVARRTSSIKKPFLKHTSQKRPPKVIGKHMCQNLLWQHFSRFALGLCFLMSKKEDNAVKLRQYREIFYNRFVQERCF